MYRFYFSPLSSSSQNVFPPYPTRPAKASSKPSIPFLINTSRRLYLLLLSHSSPTSFPCGDFSIISWVSGQSHTSYFSAFIAVAVSSNAVRSIQYTPCFFVPNIVSLFNLVHFGQILFKGLRGTEKSDIDIFYVVLVLGCLNLHLEWNLAPSIIVVESGGLLESLRRSSLLMKGKKMLAVSILLVYGSFAIILGLFSSWILEVQLSLNEDLSHGGWWKMVNSEFLFRILPASVLFMLVLLFNMVTNIVFYVYCIKPEDNEKEKSCESVSTMKYDRLVDHAAW